MFKINNKIEYLDGIKILGFYEYLGVEKSYESEICCKIGKKLEKSKYIIDINITILEKILTNFPSIYYDNRYSFNTISQKFKEKLDKHKLKYISP